MAEPSIIVTGAREHNLKNINISIPRNKMVVITGVSGSGKSSLAFDTIFAEGQRRYVESLSAYVRQFISLLEKPDVDKIEGLSPSISIDQKGVSRNPRSTVGTVTEIYDYLRLLFARVGRPHCPKCNRLVSRQTVQQIVDEALVKIGAGERFMVLSPVVTHMKGEHLNILNTARQDGFARARVDNRILSLDEEIKLNKKRWHDIDIVIDRLVMNDQIDVKRLTDSVETALKLAAGRVVIAIMNGDGDANSGADIAYSEHFACTHCGVSIQELEPRNFSFNTPYGACAQCTGLGYHLKVDPELVVNDKSLTLKDGAIAPWSNAGVNSSWHESVLTSLARQFKLRLDVPFKNLTKAERDLVLFGVDETKLEMRHITKRGHSYNWRTDFEGVVGQLERRYEQTESDGVRAGIERYMAQRVCQACDGKRLKPEVLAVTIADLNIMDFCAMSVENALRWVSRCQDGELDLDERELAIGAQIIKEIRGRLLFLEQVGLGYISVARAAATLSGGEAQRIRLATQIGSNLTGVLYVCDEPSIGLHPADNRRLIKTLSNLRDMNNSLIIVEHDEAIMRAADHIVDIGPGAGENGGEVVAQGAIDAIERCENSLTGAYLSGRRTIAVGAKSKRDKRGHIEVVRAEANNLKKINVKFPLGKLICVTGVSGSGKSTLVNHILRRAIMRQLYRSKDLPGKHKEIRGLELIDNLINIDQSPIGRTPRSNPATYTGAFTPLRELFASLPESKFRGYTPGRFSFNVKGGRCEACAGAGHTQIEMQFLPNVTVPCDVCQGARYNREALEVLFKTHSIADILNMTVAQALNLLEHIAPIAKRLRTLSDVGLDYIKLGQPATTLSGGEAQRIKLAAELSKKSTGKTLYILDEPTTGLSFYDCDNLIRVLRRLVDAGNTVVIIEHHLDFIKNADWIIDLGPGAGDEGGRVVATGEPDQVARNPDSLTGGFLRELAGASAPPKKRAAKRPRKKAPARTPA